MSVLLYIQRPFFHWNKHNFLSIYIYLSIALLSGLFLSASSLVCNNRQIKMEEMRRTIEKLQRRLELYEGRTLSIRVEFHSYIYPVFDESDDEEENEIFNLGPIYETKVMERTKKVFLIYFRQ